jgi:hypothetical protein
VQPSEQAFECIQTPCNVLQINIEDVRTSEQHRPNTGSISIQQGVVFQKSTLFGKSLQSVRKARQHVQTMSSLYKPSRQLSNMSGRYPIIQNIPELCSNAERILAKTVRTLGQVVRMQT